MKENDLKSVSDFQSCSPKGSVSNVTNDSRPRLLLLTSDEKLRDRLQESLSECFHITFLESPESLDASLYVSHDAILIDETVNGMGGDKLCFLIKSDKSIVHIPVVLLVEECHHEKHLSYLGCGADHVEARSTDAFKLKVIMQMLVDNDKALKKWIKEFKVPKSSGNAAHNKTGVAEEMMLFKRKVNDLIEMNLTEAGFTIAKLAGEMCMSRSNFYRTMKMYVQMTPEQYILKYKMDKAATLLISTQEPITEAAYKVGFSTLKYFGKKFKKLHKMCPTEYRNKSNRIE